jgi:hypothetical protein
MEIAFANLKKLSMFIDFRACLPELWPFLALPDKNPIK